MWKRVRVVSWSSCRALGAAVLAAGLLVSAAPVAGESWAGEPAEGSAGSPAALVSTAADRQGLLLTVYNGDLALVSETRTIPRGSGLFQLDFLDVPTTLVPESVRVAPAGGGILTVRQQDFLQDLVEPGRLMEKFVGREVELVQVDDQLREKRERAVLLSQAGPTYRIGDRVVVGHPGRVEFPELPAGLVLRPTLRWLLEGGKGQAATSVQATYLCGGIDWRAHYVLELDPAETSAGLAAWVAVENGSGAAYPEATLRLVAGEIHRAARREAKMRMPMVPMAAEAAPGEGMDFAEQGVAEYHLYTLDRPATLGDRQTTQLALLSAAGVPARKELVARGEDWHWRSQSGEPQEQPVAVSLRLRNDEKSGLGRPLPAGSWRVYLRDAQGGLVLLGEDDLDHRARGQEVEIDVGRSFDVTAERLQTDYQRFRGLRWDAEVAWRLTLRNAKEGEEAEVVVREPVMGEWEVCQSTHPYEKADAHTLEFRVRVPPRSAVTLEYRVAIDW